MQGRTALLGVIAVLGIKVRRYKVGAPWIDEKAGRLKFNGHLFTRSPLSDLEQTGNASAGRGRKGQGTLGIDGRYSLATAE